MKKVLAVSITIAVLIIVVFILNRELPAGHHHRSGHRRQSRRG